MPPYRGVEDRTSDQERVVVDCNAVPRPVVLDAPGEVVEYVLQDENPLSSVFAAERAGWSVLVSHVDLALQKDRDRVQRADSDKSPLFRRGRPMEVRHLHDRTIRTSSVSLGRPLPEPYRGELVSSRVAAVSSP